MRPRFVRWAVGMSLLVGFGVVALVASMQSKRDETVVHVFFETEPQATRAEEEAVVTHLRSNPRVDKVTFVSKEESLANMKERYPELVMNLVSNPLPDALAVTPIEGGYAPELVAALLALPGVESARAR